MKFKTGQSGNPKGRPKGTGSRQQLFNRLVVPQQDALLNTAIDLALNGNEPMLRVFLDRILPSKPLDDPITLVLPKVINSESIKIMSDSILRMLESEKISPDQAKSLFDILKCYKENVAFDILQQKLTQFDEWVKDKNALPNIGAIDTIN
jgi:hypothetical protein